MGISGEFQDEEKTPRDSVSAVGIKRIRDFPSERMNDYLWHFTRMRCEPFPGDDWDRYFEDLIGRGTAPYSAFHSLLNILKNKRIVSSPKLIRGGYPVVCFTAAPLGELKRLRTWQNHLARMRFSMYGIGIRKDAAEKLGIAPVIYGDDDEFESLPEAGRFRFQVKRPGGHDWTVEKEWRCRGDVDLGDLDHDSMAVSVSTQCEADEISYGFQVKNVFRLPAE